MFAYLQRLVRTGAAYQLAEVVAKFIALALLPVYTRHLTRADYGTADLLLTLVILVSLIVRLGAVEAFVRFHYHDEDAARRRRLARAATGFTLIATSIAAGVALAFAGPLSELVLGFEDATLMAITALGLWSFTNLELANALLRVDERAGAYLRASLTNVGLTVAITFYLVVLADQGARGLLLGNFVASTAVLLGLWWLLRDKLALRIDRRELPAMLRFGLPTVPAEVSIFALNLVDRAYLYRTESEGDAGLYSLAVKLAAVVIFATRAFQYAWPPLAYSVADDREAGRLYALVTTYYVLITGLVVAGLTLLGRWAVRLLAAPSFFGAHEALPWVALGWALYGLVLVLVVVAGRAQVTTRNFPAALAGLAVNVGLLLVLVGPLGIAGAGIALCGAYAVMLLLMHALTRRLFHVPFEWARLAHLAAVMGGTAVAGELLLPSDGASGLALRALVLMAIPLLLYATRFFRDGELASARRLLRRPAPSVAPQGS